MSEHRLVATVEFLLGMFRGDPDGTAHTGRLTQGEWPPSPARLFSALVAADGTRDQCRHTDGSELVWLESQTPPAIVASPAPEVEQNPQLARYVVKQNDRAVNGTVQQYPGRTQLLTRPGVRVSPRNQSVKFIWDSAPPPDVLHHLRLRAARVGYLGCAESAVRISLTIEESETLPEPTFEPDTSGSVAMSVVESGMVARLDAHYDRWLTHGPNVRRSQSPGLRRQVWYRGPHDLDPENPGPRVLHFLLDEPLSGRRVLRLTEAFRGLVLSGYQRSAGEAPPPVILGHGHKARGFLSARYLALANVGNRHADGRIHGLALWLPEGTPAEVVHHAKMAVPAGSELRMGKFFRKVRPWSGDARPLAAHPDRWKQQSRLFSSVFPVIHERSSRRLGLAEVGLWCRHAGLPDPVDFRTNRHPFIAGGVDLAPPEVHRKGKPRRPYGHFEIRFEEPVQGPIAIGAGRQFGLGLMVAPNSEGKQSWMN